MDHLGSSDPGGGDSDSFQNVNSSLFGLSFLLAERTGDDDEVEQQRAGLHILKNCSLLKTASDAFGATDVDNGEMYSGTQDVLGCLPGLLTTPAPVPEIPQEMLFSGDNLVSVIAYTVLFSLAAFGNLTVFLTLFRSRYRKSSRVNLFIMHLAMADMIVTFVMIPMEIGWHVTVAWTAGDAACRILMFWRVFGFYLSSFILITISFDRYFAILHPLRLTDADKRAKVMLFLAWMFSIVSSIPQVGYDN